jgi:hypothetical protein
VTSGIGRRGTSGKSRRQDFLVTVFYNVKGDGETWERRTIGETGVYSAVLADVGSDGDFDIVGPRTYWTGPVELWENKQAKPTTLKK